MRRGAVAGEANETADLVFRETRRSAYPIDSAVSKARLFQTALRRLRTSAGKWIDGTRRTLYQCFFTLPSVRAGNVLAISLQLLPASRSVFNRCSSAGVQGVFVLPFFGTTGLVRPCKLISPRSPVATVPPENDPTCPVILKALTLLLDEPGGSPSSEARRLRELVGDGSCDCCCCSCCTCCGS